MKWKITKQALSFLQAKFDKNDSDFEEIELEPKLDTAKEAIIEQAKKQEWYHLGYHHGFKEGWYEGQKKDWRCTCGCGGNNCYMRFCDDKCPLFTELPHRKDWRMRETQS